MTLDDVIEALTQAKDESDMATKSLSNSLNDYYRGKKAAYLEAITLLYNLKLKEVEK